MIKWYSERINPFPAIQFSEITCDQDHHYGACVVTWSFPCTYCGPCQTHLLSTLPGDLFRFILRALCLHRTQCLIFGIERSRRLEVLLPTNQSWSKLEFSLFPTRKIRPMLLYTKETYRKDPNCWQLEQRLRNLIWNRWKKKNPMQFLSVIPRYENQRVLLQHFILSCFFTTLSFIRLRLIVKTTSCGSSKRTSDDPVGSHKVGGYWLCLFWGFGKAYIFK